MLFKRLIIILLTSIISCAAMTQDEEKYVLFMHPDFHFPYEVWEPDASWKLPKKLIEISGLSYIDEDRLACVQDEKGNIYIFNVSTGEVERKISFGEDGDYEGIEVIGNDAWILKSNGTLIEVKNFMEVTPSSVQKFKTGLTRKNDAEGLAYDPLTDHLLIACKGHPFIEEEEGKEFKAIYNFNLDTKKLDLEPQHLVEMDTIKYYKNYNTMTQLGVELLAYFDHSKGDLSFQPSGIAIHPITGNMYLIGSVGNLLMVFDRDGRMLAMIKLRSKYYFQPEGICFSPDGTLYISNEGDEEPATILKFKPISP